MVTQAGLYNCITVFFIRSTVVQLYNMLLYICKPYYVLSMRHKWCYWRRHETALAAAMASPIICQSRVSAEGHGVIYDIRLMFLPDTSRLSCGCHRIIF